jgi:carbonic anhydrase/acetyltransferase-like protein (isoleucine patch superfamily)
MTLYKLDDVTVVTPSSGNYWVAPSAAVIGLVELAENASVWFGAVLRGDTEKIYVGMRSNVQDNCVLHTDPGFALTIEEDCTVGHSVILHGCQIGARSLIGMGSVILNGAVIGEECLIGANTLIPEGKIIPPRSMVLGSPGRVVRQLSDDDAAKFIASAERYVARWKRFGASLELQSGN